MTFHFNLYPKHKLSVYLITSSPGFNQWCEYAPKLQRCSSYLVSSLLAYMHIDIGAHICMSVLNFL